MMHVGASEEVRQMGMTQGSRNYSLTILPVNVSSLKKSGMVVTSQGMTVAPVVSQVA